MRQPAPPPRNPRPLAAFFLSLAGSAVVLGLFLLSDGRLLELKKAKAEIRQLDKQIADRKRENANLRSSIAAANRAEFPAEKAAREELHLVHPEDIVLLYPPAPSPTHPRPDRAAAPASLTPSAGEGLAPPVRVMDRTRLRF
jgi:cell division protein FtsB